jgi:hypothetical protein
MEEAMSSRYLLIPLALLTVVTGCQVIKSEKQPAAHTRLRAPAVISADCIAEIPERKGPAKLSSAAAAENSPLESPPETIRGAVEPAAAERATQSEEIPSSMFVPVGESISASEDEASSRMTFVAVSDGDAAAGFSSVEDLEPEDSESGESLKFILVEDEGDDEAPMTLVNVADLPEQNDEPPAPAKPPRVESSAATTPVGETSKVAEPAKGAETKAAPVPKATPLTNAVAAQPAAAPAVAAESAPAAAAPTQPGRPASAPAPQVAGIRGVIQSIDEEEATITVALQKAVVLPEGTRMVLVHKYALGHMAAVVEYEVIQAEAGRCVARPVGTGSVLRASVGANVRIIAR